MTLNEIASELPKKFNRAQLLEALKKAYGEGVNDCIQTIEHSANGLDEKHGEIKAALKALVVGLTIGKDFLKEMS